MKRKLMISCPQCEGGNSLFFKANKCEYCGNSREVDILYHHKVCGITDERNARVKSFINDPRFIDYLESRKQLNSKFMREVQRTSKR